MKIVTVDLDSTLCDTGHRQHLLTDAQSRGEPVDWAAYAAMCTDDGLVEAVAILVRLLSKEHAVHIVSGRDESARESTYKWLDKYAIPFHRVWLDAGEHTGIGHAQYKLRLLQKVEEETGGKVILHIDDWDDVTALLNANGYPTVCVRTPQEIAAAS